MKRGTDLKLKFRLLKAELGLRDWQVKGILQSIWDFTAENALAGDIGRFTDQEIATGIDYAGDASQLIEALVNSRWLDRDTTHRLLVHQWREHCEDWIFKRVQRAGGMFADGSTTASGRDSRRTTAADGGQRQTTADNGGLPGPGPGPGPGPEPYMENESTHFPAQTGEPIFEVVKRIWFPSLVGKKLTLRDAKRISALAADLSARDANPEEIEKRWATCQREFDAPGPDALIKHWDALKSKPRFGTPVP